MPDRETLNKLRESLESAMDPTLVDKFGDPFDPDDIRNVLPSERRKQDPDMSIEDEVYYLALDVEVLQRMVSLLTHDYFRRRLDEHRVAESFGFAGARDMDQQQNPGTGQYV